MATLNELVIALGFDVESSSFQKLSQFVGGVDAIAKGFEKVGQMVTGGKGFKEFLSGTASKAQDLINLSNTIGMSTESIQQWQYAAEKAGVSAQSVMGDITELTTKWRKSQAGVLALAKQIQNASPFMVQAYKNMYGLSDDMITLMRRGPDEIKKYMKEIKENGGIISDEDLKKGQEFKEALFQVKTTITNTAQAVATQYMPRIKEMADTFSDWIKDVDHQQTVLKGFKVALGGLAAASILSGLTTLAVNIKLVAGAIKALTVASWGFMATPIGMALTAIGAVGTGVYGFWNWINRENKELADRKKNPFGAMKEYGRPSGGFWSSLFSKPSTYLKGLNVPKEQVEAYNNQTINNSTAPYNGEVNITIITNEGARELATQLRQYTGIEINNAPKSYNQVG